MTPVLKKRLSGSQKFLCQLRLKAIEAGKKHDRMTSGSGDGDGVKLKITKTPDDTMSRFSCPARPAGSMPG